MRKKQLVLLLSGLAAAILILPVFWLLFPFLDSYISPSGKDNILAVSFLDVGQGDSTIIRTPAGQNILIDGGPGGLVIRELSNFLPFWDRTIDLMVLTHPHNDHVSGLIEVLKRYDVKKIIYTGVSHSGPNYIAWLELVKDQNVPVVIIDRLQTIELSEGCQLEIIYPLRSIAGEETDLNNSSIVAKLKYGSSSFLFTGDIEESVERELIRTAINLNADVLKVAHHGSDTSSIKEFLEKVSPEYALISAGKDNQFGHPSEAVLGRLKEQGAEIYRTDIDSTTTFFSDGIDIWLK